MVPIPIQTQVENLLRLGLIDDALNLFRVTWDREAAKAEATEADYKKQLAKIHEAAGMLLMQVLYPLYLLRRLTILGNEYQISICTLQPIRYRS